MKILKNKLNQKILIIILGIIVLNLAVIDFFVLGQSSLTKISSFITEKNQKAERDSIFESVNPSAGYQLNFTYGDLGPKLVSSGVIDLNKFTALYKDRGGLNQEQSDILTKSSNQKIKFTRENSNFLLNFFWAVGLVNNSKILTDGQMQTYGGNPGNFASTGGWTLSTEASMNYYAKDNLFNLTSEQDALVQKVASGIYRPCCDNSTAFPDCNHGMALLGVLEMMASKGANENQMFEAAKYINAYWFSTNYYDLARYFKDKEGKNFNQIDAKIILGKDYSSASGYGAIKKWLDAKNGTQQNNSQGSSCGV